jgi:hypothetical protein
MIFLTIVIFIKRGKNYTYTILILKPHETRIKGIKRVDR